MPTVPLLLREWRDEGGGREEACFILNIGGETCTKSADRVDRVIGGGTFFFAALLGPPIPRANPLEGEVPNVSSGPETIQSYKERGHPFNLPETNSADRHCETIHHPLGNARAGEFFDSR